MHIEQVYKLWQNGQNVVVPEYIRLDITMTVIYCYLGRENYNVLKFHMNSYE